jgi:hypothetical protein
LIENKPPGEYIFTVIGKNGYNYNTVIPPELVYDLTSDSCGAFQIDPVTGSTKHNDKQSSKY